MQRNLILIFYQCLYIAIVFPGSLYAGTVYQIIDSGGHYTSYPDAWEEGDITIMDRSIASVSGLDSGAIRDGSLPQVSRSIPLYLGYTLLNGEVVPSANIASVWFGNYTAEAGFSIHANRGGIIHASSGDITVTVPTSIAENGTLSLGSNGGGKRLFLNGTIAGPASSAIYVSSINQGSGGGIYNGIIIGSSNNSFSGAWHVGIGANGTSRNSRLSMTGENGLGVDSTLHICSPTPFIGNGGPVSVELHAAQTIANLLIEPRTKDDASALVIDSNVPLTVTGTTTLQGGQNLLSRQSISGTTTAAISLGDLRITGNAETFEWWSLSARNMHIDAGSQYTMYGCKLDVAENLTVSEGATLAVALRQTFGQVLTLSPQGRHTLAGTLSLSHNTSDPWSSSNVYQLSNVDLTGFANVVWERQMQEAGMQLLYRNGGSVVSRPWVFCNDESTGAAWNGDAYGARDVLVIQTAEDQGWSSANLPNPMLDIYLGYALSGEELLPSGSTQGAIYLTGNLSGNRLLAYRGGIYHALDNASLDLRGEILLAEDANFSLGANGANRTLNVYASLSGKESAAIFITADTKQQGDVTPPLHANKVVLHSKNNPFAGTWSIGASHTATSLEASLEIVGENALGRESTLRLHSPASGTDPSTLQQNAGPVSVDVQASQEVKSLEIEPYAELNLLAGTFTVRQSLDVQPDAVVNLILEKAFLEFAGEEGSFHGKLNLLWEEESEVDLFSVYSFLKSDYLGDLTTLITTPEPFAALGMGVHYRDGVYSLLNPAAVPEPGTACLLLLGLLGNCALLQWRKGRK